MFFCFFFLQTEEELCFVFFFQAEDGIRDADVTGVQTCALPISEINGGAPKVNDWPAWVAERPMRAVAASRSAKHLRATPRNSVPYAVGATWRVVRSNRRNPSCVSNSRIRTLRPDGVMNRAPAAREKFRCCATRRKARSCREVKSIINQDSSIIELFELVSQSALELNSHNVTGAPRWETFSAM